MYNLSIVTTPMQIINSIEAINHFNLTEQKNILVILYKPRKINNIQLKKVSKLYDWHEVIETSVDSKGSRLFEYTKLINKLKKYDINYLFTNLTTSYISIFIANLNQKKTYLIDDGSATINIYNKILLKNKLNKVSFRSLKFMLFGLKIKIRGQIGLFTYFDLEDDDKFDIVKNNLEYFKNQINIANLQDESIYFLGQPLATKKFISKAQYISYIRAIIEIKNQKIIYIPHRFEKLSSELKSLQNDSFVIQDIDLPIELYFIYNKIYPKYIISFCTSAIFSLEKMYDNLVTEHILIPKEVLLQKRDEFYGCYESLKNETNSKPIL